MNQLSIIAFGQIAEIVGPEEFSLEASDTDALQILLLDKFPELKNKKFAISVDKQLIKTNTSLNNHSVVALLPPFSGG
jgi:molybdopterin synthase sulfur carrier subunit